jgi:hypothetical protein
MLYQIMKWMSPACSKGPEIRRINSWPFITWSEFRHTRAVRLDQKCCLLQTLGTRSKWRPTRRVDIRVVPGAVRTKFRGWAAVLTAERKLTVTTPVKIPDKWPRKDAFGTRTLFRGKKIFLKPYKLASSCNSTSVRLATMFLNNMFFR